MLYVRLLLLSGEITRIPMTVHATITSLSDIEDELDAIGPGLYDVDVYDGYVIIGYDDYIQTDTNYDIILNRISHGQIILAEYMGLIDLSTFDQAEMALWQSYYYQIKTMIDEGFIDISTDVFPASLPAGYEDKFQFVFLENAIDNEITALWA